MKQLLKAAALSFALIGASPMAFAQDNMVVLKSFDQNFEVNGELLSFDDEFYNIRTAIGDLIVGREFVDCFGATCPDEEVEEEVIVADGDVTLTAGDGTTFAGKLQEYDGTNYILETAIGVLTIRGEFVDCSGASCPGGEVVENLNVTLTSGDGAFFEGLLQEYDGTNYIILTTLGQLTIRGEFVECSGEACPDTGPKIARFSVAAPAGVGELFINDALNLFAAEKSQSITQSVSADGSRINYLIGDQSGNQIADITILPADDVASIKALFSGQAAFALTREAFTAEDIAIVTDMAVQEVSSLLDGHVIALDALVAHLHISNPVRTLTISQMGDIMAGNITNWSQVGGPNLPITLYFLDQSSSLARIVERDILRPQGLRLSEFVTIQATNTDLNRAVSNDPSGFTVSYRSDSHHGMDNDALERFIESSANAAIRFSELNGAATDQGTRIPGTRNACNITSSANAFSMQTEEYPLTMRWHLYSIKDVDNSEYAERFTQYLSSDAGQFAAEDAGLVGLSITVQPLANQGERLQSAMLAVTLSNSGIRTYQTYLAEVSSGYRLSATMRFLTGTSKLDQRSLREWDRVSQLISSGQMRGNDLVLIGFSDSVGNFGANVNLSRSRAEYVKSVVLQENIGVIYPEDIHAIGFGPIAPVGCNETPEGRTLNRRVEVWVRSENQAAWR